MADHITSVQNSRIRNIVQLQSKSRERKLQNLIVIEGYREISRAAAGGIVIKELYYCPGLDAESKAVELAFNFPELALIRVSETVFGKIAYREASDGLLALAVPRYREIQGLTIHHNPLLIVLESVEKPGNLGAVMRTADAAGVSAVIICDPLTDIYNPNVIRSSLGCVFTVPLIVSTSIDVQLWLKNNRINSYAAAITDAAVSYETADYSGGCAIILGTEATGLSESWLKFCNKQIIIPMCGVADSLNVSTSAAIIIFEALRQRKRNV